MYDSFSTSLIFHSSINLPDLLFLLVSILLSFPFLFFLFCFSCFTLILPSFTHPSLSLKINFSTTFPNTFCCFLSIHYFFFSFVLFHVVFSLSPPTLSPICLLPNPHLFNSFPSILSSILSPSPSLSRDAYSTSQSLLLSPSPILSSIWSPFLFFW